MIYITLVLSLVNRKLGTLAALNALRFLTSTIALAILWLLSLSAFLAILVPCLVSIGEFFFDGVL